MRPRCRHCSRLYAPRSWFVPLHKRLSGHPRREGQYGWEAIQELVSALSWLALGSCPDIAFATGMLAHFSHNLGRAHWEAVANQLDN